MAFDHEYFDKKMKELRKMVEEDQSLGEQDKATIFAEIEAWERRSKMEDVNKEEGN